MKNKQPIRFNSQGVYASDSRLADIAAQCIAAERAAVAASRAARAANANESTWLVNW
jgi:exoribonuclease R